MIGSLVELAGLSDVVKVQIGSSDASIKRLHDAGVLKHIDLMFLDHYKPAYKSDLKLCEELKLVTKGSVLAADNVITPGNPPYLEYVRSSVEEKRQKAKQSNGEAAPDARFDARQVKQYAQRGESEALGATSGNPNLVYDSKLVKSFEPTGEPVSSTTPTPISYWNLTIRRTASKSRGVLERRRAEQALERRHPKGGQDWLRG